jgi:hypothetical protein
MRLGFVHEAAGLPPEDGPIPEVPRSETKISLVQESDSRGSPGEFEVGQGRSRLSELVVEILLVESVEGSFKVHAAVKVPPRVTLGVELVSSQLPEGHAEWYKLDATSEVLEEIAWVQDSAGVSKMMDDGIGIVVSFAELVERSSVWPDKVLWREDSGAIVVTIE